MENATKALVIAGGVLIAIMTIATLIYAANMWGVFPSAKDESESAQQLAKFNQEYEAYNKKALYGVDVISVLNKACDNNASIQEDEREELFIDVEINMKHDVESTTLTYKTYLTGPNKGKTFMEPTSYNSTGLTVGSYSLKSDGSVLEEFLNEFMNDSGKIIQNRKTKTDSDGYKYDEWTTEIVENSEFKTRIFECTSVNYDPENGRVEKMTFEERDADYYND